ncbi:hypothetical protein HY251_13395 [bacterium]|nr:hypothetical protein [bacterium]
MSSAKVVAVLGGVVLAAAVAGVVVLRQRVPAAGLSPEERKRLEPLDAHAREYTAAFRGWGPAETVPEPDEVGTIVQLRRGPSADRLPQPGQQCEATLVDRSTRKILRIRTFLRAEVALADPRASKDEVEKRENDAQVLAWLRGLPRR